MTPTESAEALDRTLRHATELCRLPTVSGDPNGPAAAYVAEVLGRCGCGVEVTTYEDARGVTKTNVIGRIGPEAGAGRPGLAFAAHTDVVPADDWHDATPGPFEPTVVGDRLYARGACDMKGPLAAMLTAVGRAAGGRLDAPLYLIATADEEVGFVGARRLRESSAAYARLTRERVPVVVGEPTELRVVRGHKGSCLITVTADGVAGHSSGTTGRNANWTLIPFLAEMAVFRDETERESRWRDDRFVPPTLGWNVTVNDANRAVNVTSERAVCRIYVRPMPAVSAEPVIARLTEMADRHGLRIDVERAGGPVLVDADRAFVTTVRAEAGAGPAETVSYGTDAAVFAADVDDIVVCGPGSIAQAHTRDEFITLDQLARGAEVFGKLIERCCVAGEAERPGA